MNSQRLMRLAIVYVCSYIPLSVFGEYLPVPSGRMRIPGSYALVDSYVWMPLFTRSRSKAFRTCVSLVYFPLICIDRAVVHKKVWMWE